jgi:hypothetical protein
MSGSTSTGTSNSGTGNCHRWIFRIRRTRAYICRRSALRRLVLAQHFRSCRKAGARSDTLGEQKANTPIAKPFIFNGRGGGIRTRDPLRPRQVRYQAALRPDICWSLQSRPLPGSPHTATRTKTSQTGPTASNPRLLSFASRFICSFICEYFLKTSASPCRSSCVTHSSATLPIVERSGARRHYMHVHPNRKGGRPMARGSRSEKPRARTNDQISWKGCLYIPFHRVPIAGGPFLSTSADSIDQHLELPPEQEFH